tara:strand:- start:11 stop:898 length:888 start_codon:yes stop_codon:yes gene_type:complete
MTKSTTRVAADLETFTQTEITAKDVVAKAGRKNLIINGGFDVWQRGTSHAAGTAGGITYTTDRWWRYGGGSGTLEKSTDAPSGFANSFYVNSTGALAIGTTVELPRLGYFPQQVMTFSMYVKGSFTGNIVFNFRNVSGSGTDQVAISTQSQAGFYSEWTRLSFTVDTIGITPHANNTALNIEMGVQAGCRITGVQLELGSVATPFEYRSYGEELALCQRYYEIGNTYRIATGNGESDHQVGYCVTKQSAASISILNTANIHNHTVSATYIGSFYLNGSGSNYSNFWYDWTAEAEL